MSEKSHRSDFELLVLIGASRSSFFRVDFGSDIDAWSWTYDNINITSGTVVVISIIDSQNEEAWSGAVRLSAQMLLSGKTCL